MRARSEDGFEYMSLDDFEEYLADKPANEKWELLGGRVVKMMVGARWEHNRIVQNITTAMMIDFRRRGSDCRPFAETFYLKQRFMDLAALPDVMVRCGPLDKEATSLSDPAVLVEVASSGTARRDRGEKWSLYKRLPSLQHYVIVARDEVAIDVLDRQGDGWLERPTLTNPSALLTLPAIGFEMPVAEVYRDVLG